MEMAAAGATARERTPDAGDARNNQSGRTLGKCSNDDSTDFDRAFRSCARVGRIQEEAWGERTVWIDSIGD